MIPEHRLVQSQELRQELILAPQQLQSLEILLAPLLELQEKLDQELVQNPVLEQDTSPVETLVGDFISATETASDAREVAESLDSGDGVEAIRDVMERAESWSEVQSLFVKSDTNLPEERGDEDSSHEDGEIRELLDLADSWGNGDAAFRDRGSFTPEEAERREHFFASLAEEPSLQEQLLEQLRFSDAPFEVKEVAELVVGSIDEQGYLRSHLADLSITANVDLSLVEKALSLVQSFDPPGIGARDLRECLLLQLRRKETCDPLCVEIVENHLEELARNRFPQIARALRIPVETLYNLVKEIRSLNPGPGSALSKSSPIFVIPEVTVEEINGEFVIRSNDEHLPRLRISQLYCRLLENPDTSDEAKAYIRAKLASGKSLIRSIGQRQSTIRKIAEIIVDSQYDFLRNGIESLRPLTMQQVADKIGMHETTVSRAIANKYIQTPIGLFELRFFFTGGYQSTDGEEVSNRSIKEKIREIVLDEDARKPLSDQAIAELLEKDGLNVARRTIAKYREELGIPSSNLRKEF